METEVIPNQQVASYTLTPKQTEAFDIMSNDQDEELLFGGGKGGAKTFFECVWAVTWVHHLIKLFGLKETKYPIPLGFWGRKRAIDFKDTTLETFKRIIPSNEYEFHDDEREIIFKRKAKIFCGGLDDQKVIEKFNSSEFAFIILGQAEETFRKDVSVLQGSLRLKLNGITPPYKQLYTANPAQCWIKEHFITQGKGKFIKALYKDNPHLPDNYVTTLEKAFGHDPTLLKAYRDGDWDSVQDDYTLIPSAKIEALKGIVIHDYEVKKILACDPSQGGDECVIYLIRNNRILDKRFVHYNDTMKVAGECVSLASIHKTRTYAIDTIGIGKGVGDRINEMNAGIVHFVNSAEKATDERFANKRAEMWWYLMEKILNREIEYPQDEELRRQITSVRYKVVNSNGKIQLEPKEETKKRLGNSPDRADAFVYGIYHLQFVQKESVNINRIDGYKILKDSQDEKKLSIVNY